MQDSIHLTGEGRTTGILVVDEEAVVRMTTADILSDAGYSVDEAANAEDALTLLELRPDVRILVTDVTLPGLLDGMALARITDLRWPGVRVIVASSSPAPGPGELPRRSRFLAKPYPASALLALVRDLLDPAAPRGFEAVFIDPLHRPAGEPITVAAHGQRPAAPEALPPGLAAGSGATVDPSEVLKGRG